MRILKLGWLILFVLIFDPCLPVLLAESQPEISFKLYDGFAIVIRGSIANEANLNLMVDTGAVPTAINQRLARKLKMMGSREDIAVVNERIWWNEWKYGTCGSGVCRTTDGYRQ
jgi:hypothetical protein